MQHCVASQCVKIPNTKQICVGQMLCIKKTSLKTSIKAELTCISTIKFIQANDSNVHQGTSILSMTELAIKKGCKLICINAENAFYVRKNLYKKFKIKNNSISALKCYKEPLSVYQLFDGTLKFDGEACLLLPSFIRKQGSMWGGGMAGLIIRLMFKILRAIKLRNKNYDYNSWRM